MLLYAFSVQLYSKYAHSDWYFLLHPYLLLWQDILPLLDLVLKYSVLLFTVAQKNEFI